MKSIWNPPTDTLQQDSSKKLWGDAENWQPNQVPTDEAVFTSASSAVVSFDPTQTSSVSQILFDETAQGFTFTFTSSEQPMLSVVGEGIVNNSTVQQSFVIAAHCSGFNQAQLTFQNSACAGNQYVYFSVGAVKESDYGGGVLHFQDESNAGKARFNVWTGAGVPPKKGSTVGGEVAFSDNSHAAQATFIIYGSLGVDGDTFGNVVFHDSTSASQALFENIGGTVSGGDGGNTQFYGTSSAAEGIYHNYGGTHAKANGGDVAFDASATGAEGTFHNYPAKAYQAYGGVTSFNNNWPDTPCVPASAAGQGLYINYGAGGKYLGGGGHTSFSAKYGSCTAEKATIENRGSSLKEKSSAGHTIFSITTPSSYYPSAGSATIYNYPATVAGGAAGFTAFSVYASKQSEQTATTNQASNTPPTAEYALIKNYGGIVQGATGGYTEFYGNSSAGNATLMAHSGYNGGEGGAISFYDRSNGENAKIVLEGNARLNLSNHQGALSVRTLTAESGEITTHLGQTTTTLVITESLSLSTRTVRFQFYYKTEAPPVDGSSYEIMQAPNMSHYTSSQFTGNAIGELEPIFEIKNDTLKVSFKATT